MYTPPERVSETEKKKYADIETYLLSKQT